MPSKGADIEGGARGTRDSIGRDQADKDRARDAATKSKMADMQSYGATPTSAEPTKAEAQALGDAIDRMTKESTGISGMLNDLFGIKQSVRQNPKTGEWDVWGGKEISPTRMGIGMAANALGGPIAGKIADVAMGQLDFEDPLGFDIGGFAGERKDPSDLDQSQRDGNSNMAVKSPVATAAPQTPAGNAENNVSSIDAFVENLLKQFQYTVFDMPDFEILDKDFGKVQSEELKKLFDSFADKTGAE